MEVGNTPKHIALFGLEFISSFRSTHLFSVMPLSIRWIFRNTGVVEPFWQPLDLLFSMKGQEGNSFDFQRRHYLSCTYDTLTSTPEAKRCSYELIKHRGGLISCPAYVWWSRYTLELGFWQWILCFIVYKLCVHGNVHNIFHVQNEVNKY